MANWRLVGLEKPGEKNGVSIWPRHEDIYAWWWPLEQDDQGKLKFLLFLLVKWHCSDIMFMLFFFQANLKLPEFQYKSLQLEELDNLFIDNIATYENAWPLGSDEPIPSEGRVTTKLIMTLDQISWSRLTPSFLSRGQHGIRVDAGQEKKLKISAEKTTTRLGSTMKREITQWVVFHKCG